MRTCIIIEDQLPAQRLLKKYVEDAGDLQLEAIFSNTHDAREWLESNIADLMFLDIHLPQVSGIEFLKSLEHPPQVILTTAFPDYALESYDLNVVDYLLKPFSYERFLQAISKLAFKEPGEKGKSNRKELVLKSGHEFVRIIVDEIKYINSDADYTDVYFGQDQKFISSASLKNWEDTLKGHNFLRVHRSFIVNLDKINKLTRNKILLTDGKEIPVGRTYKSTLAKNFLT